jgi:leucyl aminopeptidase
MADAPKFAFAAFSAPTKGALVVFCDDSLKFGPATRKALAPSGDLITRAAKAEHFTGKSATALSIPAPQGLKVARLVVVGLGKAAALKQGDFLRFGGVAMSKIPASEADTTIFAELAAGAMSPRQAADLAMGARLRSYRFDRYKTKRKEQDKRPASAKVMIAVGDVAAAQRAFAPNVGVADGVMLARDLVNEPANILYPDEFARRALALRKQGVKVEVLDVRAMRKLGMNALLGVGQGSRRDSRLVVMQWNGG